jgi:hypothetical protein
MPDLKEVRSLIEGQGVTPEVASAVASALKDAGFLAGSVARAPTRARAPADAPTERLSVEIQHAVAGYCAGQNRTISGTWEEVAQALDQAAAAHHRKVEQAWERNGDYRGYCPQFANGYPSGDPSGDGTVTTSVVEARVERLGSTEKLSCHDPRVAFLRGVANGEFMDPVAALEGIAVKSDRARRA